MRTEYLFKHFMLVQSAHLPILGNDSVLIGFLSKEKLLIEMADLSRGNQDFDRIPEDFLDTNLPETLLYFFQNYSKILVLDESGNKKDYWDKAKLLSEYSKWVSLRESKSSENGIFNVDEAHSKESESNSSKDPISWLVRKILESFADPLFATDLEGNSLFFNENFESKILGQSMFRNSVQFAERFLRDLNKDVFAAFLKANELDISKAQENGRILQTMLPQLGYQVRIVTLTEKEKLIGYLYHFVEMRSRIVGMDREGGSFPSLEEAFAQGMPLDLVLSEVESFYIFKSLLKNRNNVSHASQELGVPRSTLQNRIKQLDLEKKFPMNPNEPVPRKKSIEAEKLIPRTNSPSKSKSKTSRKVLSQKKTTPKVASKRLVPSESNPPRKKTSLSPKKSKKKK